MQNDLRLEASPRPGARRRLSAVEVLCCGIGVGLILVGLSHLLALWAYPRPWLGPLSWRKPITFGVSFGVVLLSITWVTSYLTMSSRLRGALLSVFALDCVVEVAGVTIQAWRDVPSHFDTANASDKVVAFSLAVGGAVLIVTLGAFAAASLRAGVNASPPMQRAIRAGFLLLMAGLAAGIAMIVRGEQLIHSGHLTLAYNTAGFLKAFHGIALHAILVIPAIAWWLNRTRLTVARQLSLINLTIAAYLLAAAVSLVICLSRV
ncbi:hypothetical protein SAMN05892883_3755 [Jatrophihabitans sp. GAS493]|uniref:hypothetical protein n=1 Tax=Jatrophihabitans sp. GAS493 TaxID=1907575 RepID=UPI000BB69ED2|nr:hypothetical protein [Jatrophihabitans sp. GAS493]SOD74569.1 hypothetical protein SAMN05892883_3755 [Jatrophihabitans sp. GAS493]